MKNQLTIKKLFAFIICILDCQTNSDCNEPGYDYNGGDMQGGSHQGIATANECSCLCEENSNCVAWTWVESKNIH